MERSKAWSAIVLGVIACHLAGCASVRRDDQACSGVPGDPETPYSSDASGVATHGPGAPGAPIEITASSRPSDMDVTSLLYVYDADARHVNRFHPMSAMLADPAFGEAEQRAFWGEVVGESFHLVPELDACSQAAMLRDEVSFKAPPGGLLFMQFVAPGCTDCRELSSAIVSFTASNPGMPVRWVRITVPRSPGGWHREPR